MAGFVYRLGFIGAGNMAEAIARAATRGAGIHEEQIIASDPSEERRAVFNNLDIATVDDNAELIEKAERIVLAVKPQSLDAIGDDLKRIDSKRQLVVSIMAGVTLARLESAVGGAGRYVRTMPNTPLMVQRGMTGIAAGPGASEEDTAFVRALFSGAGEVIEVDEPALDAVTAVSGSGPAYLFYLAEAMERAAAGLGLGEHAALLARQTLLGAAELLNAELAGPAELRRRVTSPGGTTQAAIGHMDATGVGDGVVAGIEAAAARSRELAG